MKKLVLAGLVAISVSGADYKITSKFDNPKPYDPEHSVTVYNISCSNGKSDVVSYFYNMKYGQYFVLGKAGMQSLDEAANHICSKSTDKVISIKENTPIFDRETGNDVGDGKTVIGCLTQLGLCKINIKLGSIPVASETTPVKMNRFIPAKEIVIDQYGNNIWNVSASDTKKIKSKGYKKFMLPEGYYEVEDSKGKHFILESGVEK